MATQYYLIVEKPEPLAIVNGPTVTVSGKAYSVSTPKVPDGGDVNPRIVTFGSSPDNQEAANYVTVSAPGAQEIKCDVLRILNTWSCQLEFKETGTIQIQRTIKIVAEFGSAREQATRTIKINLDTKVPTVSIDYPRQKQRISGAGPKYQVEFRGTADDDRGIASIRYAVDGEPRGAVSSAGKKGDKHWDWTFVADLSLGDRTVVVTAVDIFGLEGPTTRRITTVDSGAPSSVAILSHRTDRPTKKTWQMGRELPVDVRVSAKDDTSPIKTVKWRVNIGRWQSAAAEPGQTFAADRDSFWKFGTSLKGPGLYDFEVQAFDTANNGSKPQLFQVDVALPLELEELGTPAYLEDLIIFADRRIETETQGEVVTKELLRSSFHQPFDHLINEEFRGAAQSLVCQVRIAVEVLRSYLNDWSEDGCYCEATFHALLTQFGTSYEELRLARNLDGASREELASRLGISSANIDALSRLGVTPSEHAIDRYFGLLSTMRDPLATGVKLTDTGTVLQHWLFRGVQWRHNTDEGGVVFIDVDGSAGDHRVDIYRDADKKHLVASGSSDGASALIVRVSEQNGSGLSGRIELNGTVGFGTVSVATVPAFLAWKLHGLREQWTAQDWSPIGTAEHRPHIDPDLIGQQQLRQPMTGDPAFDLLSERRAWAEHAEENLKALPEPDRLWGKKGTEPGEFDWSGSIAVSPDGERIYISDRRNARIQVFTLDGNLVEVLGRKKADDEEEAPGVFIATAGISVDEEENLYVACSYVSGTPNSYIHKYHIGEKQWSLWGGKRSREPGSFYWPSGVTAAPDGYIYVADNRNHRVQKLTREGQFVSMFGESGSSPGQFNLPVAIAFTPAGDLLVTDQGNHRVQRFDTNGNFLGTWGSAGSGPGELNNPLGIAVDQDGIVYIADAFNNRIQVFTDDGKFIRMWGGKGDPDVRYYNPYGVAIDGKGFLYVTDTRHFRIHKIDTRKWLWTPYERTDELTALDEAGEDISPELDALGISRAGFDYFARIRRLEQAGADVLDEEWDGIRSILVQVQKTHRFPAWRDTERQLGITLSPDFFSLEDARFDAIPAWRGTEKERRLWCNTLAARIKQEQSLREAHAAALAAVEEITLPSLRDSLISSIPVGGNGTLDVADWLTQRLSISFKYSGDQRIARVEQALETLQDLLFGLRAGRFEALPELAGDKLLSSWHLDIGDRYSENDFDTEWKWMGTYGAWRAAMFVFGYPENYLYPTLRRQGDWTEAYKKLVMGLRQEWRLKPETARNLAKDYIDSVTKPDFTVIVTDELSKDQLRSRREKSLKELKPHFDARNGGWEPETPQTLLEAYFFVPMLLGLALQKSGEYLAALDWFQTVYAYDLPPSDRKIFYGLEAEETIPTEFRRTFGWLTDGLDPHDIARDRANAYTSFTVLSIVRCFLAYADSEFTRETNESILRARRLYMNALGLLDWLQSQTVGVHEVFGTNPVLRALRSKAELNLYKLRNGRNIAGMERSREALAAAEMDASGGVLVPRRTGSLRPTPYRYSALIERAKQLVNIAQQIEAAFLSAVERGDAENYTLLRARHDIALSKATVELQDLRVDEADGGINLAMLQKDSAQIQAVTYAGWIAAGKNEYENAMLSNYIEIMHHRNKLAEIEAEIALRQTAEAVASSSTPWGAGARAMFGGQKVLFVADRLSETERLNTAETEAQFNAFNASYERRKQEWILQVKLGKKDVEIGAQQIALAEMHQQIVDQERDISALQQEHAEAVVDYLTNKFTNVELYEWMSGVLSQVYSYFLQQATSMAQLAQSQLAFERQESPPAFIQADYWELPTNGEASVVGNDRKSPDRRGLTGSARLLQDIYQLDLHAFNTNKRKLQLTQTFSLARLAPYELQRFRDTGVLTFATPMRLFDQGFPGHYLRLVKRVRISVVALIPPTQGIRAALSAAGLSRVVIGGDVYRTINIRRAPEMIAFTSPINATGLFELQPEDELLLPFEGMGVDTTWELEMPKAANAFDYGTMADVLLTIEYTALYSEDYRQQVVRDLDHSISAERALSVKQDLPDVWYHLHNPDGGAEAAALPIALQFDTPLGEFPPNLVNLRIDHVVLYFARARDASFEAEVTGLRYSEGGDSSRELFLTGSTSNEGVISTRRGNAAAWMPLIGKSPAGRWAIELPNTEGFKARLAEEQIEDILFVIGYSGDTPAWPA